MPSSTLCRLNRWPRRALSIALAAMASLFLFATSELVAEEVKIVTKFRFDPPETVSGVLELPEGGGPFPAVILMHGCGGLGEYAYAGLRNHAAALRGQGFATLILDSFGLRGWDGDEICNSGPSSKWWPKTWYKRSADAFSAHEFLEGHPDIDGRNIFAMGQSNGGSVAIVVAQNKGQFYHRPNRKFRAVVAYYPFCGIFDGPTLLSPLLVFAGEKDEWTPPKNCQLNDGYMTGEPYEIVVYPDTYHSFDLPDLKGRYAGQSVRSNPGATEDSRARMISFFKAHLVE